MSNGHQVDVDFISEDTTGKQWNMILVEQGPWRENVEKHLMALQRRLYGCIDAALDGELALQFPNSANKPVGIRVDCYNLPEGKVREFFDNFSGSVFKVPDYQDALKESKYVNEIIFSITFDSIH